MTEATDASLAHHHERIHNKPRHRDFPLVKLHPFHILGCCHENHKRTPDMGRNVSFPDLCHHTHFRMENHTGHGAYDYRHDSSCGSDHSLHIASYLRADAPVEPRQSYLRHGACGQ